METFELIAVLIVGVVALVWLANRINIPYPMLLMAGGLLIAILPGTPAIELAPEVVLVVFLPPILFPAAQTTSVRDFKANFSTISRLAIGLVLFTTLAVAVIAHWVIPGIGWPATFVLGAVVSPPDAVAATAIFQRLGAPSRIVTILEGESLINDASAIVLYTFAVAAVVTGEFSVSEALLEFVLVVAIGILIGAVIGQMIGWVTDLLEDPSLALMMLLLTPAGTYLLAERLGGPGVLAVVTAGLIHGFIAPRTLTSTLRLRSQVVWDLVIVVINGLVFPLIGLEMGVLRDVLSDQKLLDVLWHSLAVVAVLVAARFLYVFATTWNQSRRGTGGPALDHRYQFVIAWSGLRGVITLATVIALPVVVDSGEAFDHRDEIILISAFVVVVSLFGFGLPLPAVLKRLNFARDDSHERELRLATGEVYGAMFEQYHEAIEEHPELADTIKPLIRHIELLKSRAGSLDAVDHDGHHAPELSRRTQVRLRGIAAGREVLIDLRDKGDIGDEVRRIVKNNLDLEELHVSG
jgi:CPA1 family monovalent cation:H+ antiporter